MYVWTSNDTVFQFSFRRMSQFFVELDSWEGWGRFLSFDTEVKSFCFSGAISLFVLKHQTGQTKQCLGKTITFRVFFFSSSPSIYQPSCPSLWCGDPVQCPELKGGKWRVENPRVPLTHRVSNQTLWWMTLIFLSASDHFYVYLDIFLMVFHLSSRTGQDRKKGDGKRESIKEMERGGIVGSKEKQAAGGQWKTEKRKELAGLKLSVNWYKLRNNQGTLLFIYFAQDVKVIVF